MEQARPTRLHPGQRADFTVTKWSVVRRAGDPSSPESAAALEALCRTYWYPIYAFLRREGRSAEDAKDLTQEFFYQLLRKNAFAIADPNKGRFRNFLLRALKNFLADEWDKANAQKRGGDFDIISLDQLNPEERYILEPVTSLTPEMLFQRKWAGIVVDHALRRVKKETAASGKGRMFDALKVFIINEPEKADYKRLSESLKMSPNTIATNVKRLRSRFGELLRAEVAETVDNPEDVEDELRAVLSAITSS